MNNREHTFKKGAVLASSKIEAQRMGDQEYMLPQKDFKDLPMIIRARAGKPLNLSLYFDKYISWSGKGSRSKDEAESVAKLKNQRLFFDGLNPEKSFKGIVPSWTIPREEYNNYLQRFQSLKKMLGTQGYFCQNFSATVMWRLVIDLGAESVYETSINLHRNYGVPIIPGSAVKGCTKAYMRKEVGDKEKERGLQEIFGDQQQKGSVIFFDALPAENMTGDFLKLDIMNVHYADYYRGESTPGDWMEPTPITFLVVEKAKYVFSVASKKEELAERVSASLKKALNDTGIGAKTSAGYGYFTV